MFRCSFLTLLKAKKKLSCYVFARQSSAGFISISNISHAKYKLSQALLLNYEKSP